jgi:GMP synthase (glutamine-hydrolysing)
VKTAIAIRHVHFEGLGILEEVLEKKKFQIQFCDIGDYDLESLSPTEAELVIFLGGPIGVYDDTAYPFLALERSLLHKRMEAGRPTLGICLGAQLMAAALGAKVYPSGTAEIGFAPIHLTDAGVDSPLKHLDNASVLHWHGDTFDLPDDVCLLASTSVCRHQAFSRGPNLLALQFHPEVENLSNLEKWLVGHAVELTAARIDPRELRSDMSRLGSALHHAARSMFASWLQGLKF